MLYEIADQLNFEIKLRYIFLNISNQLLKEGSKIN